MGMYNLKFHKCEHPHINQEIDINWFSIDSDAHNALMAVAEKPKLLNDLKKMALFKQIG